MAGVVRAVGPVGASSARATPATAKASHATLVRHTVFRSFMVYPLIADLVVRSAPADRA
jgi:hypothetical protein